MHDALKILIVDDDPLNLDSLEQELGSANRQVISAANGQQAMKMLSRNFPGIVVTDLKMPQMDGLELLTRTREIDPELPVILVTGYGDVPTAVDAIQQGAYDFIDKPIDPERLNRKVSRALRDRGRVLEIRRLRAELIDARIPGRSPPMVELRSNITNLADTDATVLVKGETGVGKELVARCLHDLSGRKEHHFVPINCAAMPENLLESELFGYEAGAFTGAAKRRSGKFEHAHGGTLLYFRLNVAQLDVPALRERRDDIPLLFQAFLQEFAVRHEREPSVTSLEDLQSLVAHSWPGNVRELRNVAERHVLGLTRQVGKRSGLIGPLQSEPRSLPQLMDEYEKCVIEQALRKNNGNIQATADALGIPVRTLNDRMRKHGLKRKDYL